MSHLVFEDTTTHALIAWVMNDTSHFRIYPDLEHLQVGSDSDCVGK